MKILSFILLAFCIPTIVFGQNNCAHDMSTDPEDPVNSALPITTVSDPNPDLRYLNTFNWYQQADIPLDNMLPIYPTLMTHLRYDSSPYYHYLSQGEELTPANGWELMLFNIGQYPDQSPMVPTGSQDLPYIALYNRHTGILRVFGTYGVSPIVNGGLSFDGLRITLKFDKPEIEANGNLRLRNGNDVPLDQNTEVVLTQAMALHTNSPSQWFSADFQLTYDPCVCFYPSALRFQFDFFESKEIDLYGRSITVDDEMADGSHLLNNQFLSNFQNTVTDVNGNFITDDQIIMYKVMEDFVDDYLEKLTKYKTDLAAVQEYNKEIDRKLFVVNLFKNVVINGVTNGIASFVGQSWFQDGIEWADDFIPPLNSDSTSIADYRKKIEDSAKKAIGSGVETFIKKNFEKKKEPTKPDAPTASFTELSMTGRLIDFYSVEKPAFYTPGTYGTEGTGTPTLNNDLAYPIYNNAVGTFALLNSPKIKASETGTMNLAWYTLFDQYNSWSRNYQFQLANELYYAINDINVKSHNVRVAFEINGQVKKLNSDLHPTYSYLDHPNTINVSSDDVNTGEYYPISTFNNKGYNEGANFCILTFESDGYCDYEPFELPNSSYSKDTLTFTTEYLPLDAISPMIFSVGIVNQYFDTYYGDEPVDPMIHGRSLEDIKLKMKLLIDVVYEDRDENGENITETLMFTYDVNNIEWVTTPLETDLQNSTINYSEYEANLTLNTTVFDGSSVDGCKLVGTHYTCHGWDDVTIVGDLTTTTGHTVEIFGGNNVFVLGESNVSPEIVLAIRTLLDYSDPMPLADGPFIEKFCKNELPAGFPGYSANLPNKSALAEYEAYESAQKTPKQPLLELSLFPVPAQNILNIRSSIELSGETFVLMDLTGRKLECSIKKIGGTMYELDVSKLADGAYYLSTFSNEGESKRMFNVLRIN